MYDNHGAYSNIPDDLKEKRKPLKAAERFVDISGENPGGRPKAHVMLRYYELYSDGRTNDLQVIQVDKPIVSVFKHPGFVNVLLNFRQQSDMDLRMFWSLLMDYSNPLNSVDYLPEEIESGYYMEGEEKKRIFFPLIELTLSPVGKESEYQMHGINPAFFTLAPASPADQEACVLQFTFPEQWFVVDEDLDNIDLAQLQHEVMEELSFEMGNEMGNPV